MAQTLANRTGWPYWNISKPYENRRIEFGKSKARSVVDGSPSNYIAKAALLAFPFVGASDKKISVEKCALRSCGTRNSSFPTRVIRRA